MDETPPILCMPDEWGNCTECRCRVLTHQVCGVATAAAQPQEMLWGDYTEWAFAQLGITKEWYIDAKQKLGLLPACWCEERKQWLNKAQLYARRLKRKLLPKKRR